jgi:hypothetical protein
MYKYKKGITITADELKVLQGSIESAINNKQMNGMSPESFKTAQGIQDRLKESKA